MNKKRTVLGIAGIILILLGIVAVLRYRIANKSIPDYNKDIQLNEITQKC